jgi:aldose 1-epimerase
MVAQRTIFGVSGDGRAVELLVLRGGGLTLKLLSWGCVVQDLRIEGHAPPLVLGFDKFENYIFHSPFFGATVGRYANRIAHGRFRLDGRSWQVDQNEAGKHHLHGGRRGIGSRNWRVVLHEEDRAVLEIIDPAGWMGYPGNCRITAEFQVGDNGLMTIRYSAETDRPTVVNLAHHGYFNLGGTAAIGDHLLRIEAESYLPVDEELIPLPSGPQPVEGTVFDFRNLRPIDGAGTRFDNNFCVAKERGAPREVATLLSPKSGISMTVETTEPGLQFYDGSKIDLPVPGLEGVHYARRAGLCLEPQIWPDAPNRSDFPSAILMPEDVYYQETRFRFAR